MLRVASLIAAFTVALVGAGAAAADPPPVSVYAAADAIDYVRVSPDGTRLAYIRRTGDELQLVVEHDAQPLYSARLGTPTLSDVQWMGPDQVLMITRAVSGGSDFLPRQTFSFGNVVNVTTGTMSRLLTDTRNLVPVLNNNPVRVTLNGAPTAMLTGLQPNSPTRHISVFSLFSVDLSGSGRASLVDEGYLESSQWIVDPSGNLLARSLWLPHIGKWRLQVRDGNAWRQVLERSATEPLRLYGVGPTPGWVLAAETIDGVRTAFEINLADGRLGPSLAPAGRAVDGPLVSGAGMQVIGLRLQGDEQTHSFFNPALQARWDRTLRAFSGRMVRLSSISDDLQTLVVEVEGGDHSESAYYIVSGSNAELIGETRPDLPAGEVGPSRTYRYTARDGLAVSGVLTLPPHREAHSLPVVVLVHDGPDSVAPSEFNAFAQMFASRGYAVFQPNFRGSTGPTAALQAAGRGQWATGMQTDIEDGVRALVAEGLADPARTCIAGGGYGGYAAVAAVTLRPGAYRCAASLNGYFELEPILETSSEEFGPRLTRAARLRRALGADADDSDRLRALSLIRAAARASAPVLLIHSREETVVPIEQSNEMRDALTRARHPPTFVTLEHALQNTAERQQAMEALLAFVLSNNPPG